MAMNVQPRRGRFQLRVTHALLSKPFFFTFDDEADARSYGTQLEALLARGVVPAELLATKPNRSDDPMLVEVVGAYMNEAPITDSDDELLQRIKPELVGVRVSEVTFQWVDAYVRHLKLNRNIAPSTIRKRVEACGRVLDWHLRRVTPNDKQVPANAFRLLPPGYSTYSRNDAVEAEALDKIVKSDEARDRRLLPEEEQAIERALAGVKREDRERALEVDPEFQMLFRLMLDTGLRLKEAWRLRIQQVDLQRGLLNVEGSKGHRGKLKPRTVPLKPALAASLRTYCRGRAGLLFSFWDGAPEALEQRRVSSRLSVRFGNLFAYAGVDDFSAHDLRHEATCRWVELRNSRGQWAFSEVEICKIMGWSDMRMMLRYASLRGEDLVARMS